MRSALRSSFFRFFKTKLFLLVLIFAVVLGFGVVIDSLNNNVYETIFRRPRYLDNTFLFFSIAKISIIVPFASAIFCTNFTGSDIAFRSINNKISTGLSRTQIFVADYVVSVFSTLLTILIDLVIIFVTGKLAPVKSLIKINKQITGLILMVTIVCLAFTSVYMLFQYFFSNKLLGLIISLLMLPFIYCGTMYLEGVLSEPYRYTYTNEQTGETYWETNPKYISGSARNTVNFIYTSSPVYSLASEDFETINNTEIMAGAVWILSSAAGILAINKKEYS